MRISILPSLTSFKIFDKIIPFCRGITIQTTYHCLRKKLFQLNFHPFSAKADFINSIGQAIRADNSAFYPITAVMTDKSVCFLMHGQGDLAVAALDNMAAVPADNQVGKTPPVKEKQALVMLLEIISQGSS